MRKLFALVVAFVLLFVSGACADKLNAGNIVIEYNSMEDLQAIYAAVLDCMASDYKTMLFDADTYDRATFIVGKTFPAGRYYVYPVDISGTNTGVLTSKLIWWNANEVGNYNAVGGVYVWSCETVELTDGLTMQFFWDEDERDVYIAMQQQPDAPTNLMNLFD